MLLSDQEWDSHSQIGMPASAGPVVPEILAPAGGREQFFAALNSGADAVFLGLKQFNARSRAENFSVDDLRSLVPMAHRYGMKVLVTLNILIKDIELRELIRTLAELEDLGVHALIVQDLGVAEIARKYFPSLRLHASTQMAVHNLAGVRKAMEWGFKRVVLARELTAQEIKRIRAAITPGMVELEVFCHGSLCYSYSGLCFFSGAADARSGNRGECAYTCREPYKIVSEPGHGFLFSMRDLDTSHKLDLMVQAGVDTLKIEGRKKDAQYVASVVKLYRRKLDDHFGKSTLRESAPPLARESLAPEAEIRNDMQLSFQRQTTSFFFEGRYHENVIDLGNPTHQGLRVGSVVGVRGNVIEVRTIGPIERFDGLKIVERKKVFHAKPQDGEHVEVDARKMGRRYDNDEIAFSVREMKMKGRWIPEANAGMLVEIELPAEVARPRVGDDVFKTRSAELRRRVEKLKGVPVDARLRPLKAVRAEITAKILDDGTLSLDVVLVRSGEAVARVERLLGVPEMRQKGSLTADIKDVLHIFGDAGVYVDEFSWAVEDKIFVPRSVLKDMKKSLEDGLAERCTQIALRHEEEALRALDVDVSPRPAVTSPKFSIKIDRVEYLAWVQEMLNDGLLAGLEEVIFEPKKAFLQGIDPAEFLEPLKVFRALTVLHMRLALPTVIRAWDEPVLKRWLQAARDEGFASYEIGNVGALAHCAEWGLSVEDIASDFTLYGLNRMAIRFWRDQGVKEICLSIEDDKVDISSIVSAWPAGIEPVAILYKDTPLFVAESCSLTALHNGCPTNKVCGYRSLEIENSKGERFMVAHEGCKSVVYGTQAYSISDARIELQNIGVAKFRVDFLTRHYARDEFGAVLRAVWGGNPVAGTHQANYAGTLK